MVGLLVTPGPACGSSLVLLQLHPRVSMLLKEFGEMYAILKNPHKLDFKAKLGTVLSCVQGAPGVDPVAARVHDTA